MKTIFDSSKLKYFKFETILNEIVNGVLTLGIYQFDPISRIRRNLLWGGLISRGSNDGIHSLAVARTTTNAKGLHEIKKHRIHAAEGRDIRAPVPGAPIEFKRTVACFKIVGVDSGLGRIQSCMHQSRVVPT